MPAPDDGQAGDVRTTGTETAASAPQEDPLGAVRARIARTEDLPLADRVAAFETVNDQIVAQLTELDEL